MLRDCEFIQNDEYACLNCKEEICVYDRSRTKKKSEPPQIVRNRGPSIGTDAEEIIRAKRKKQQRENRKRYYKSWWDGLTEDRREEVRERRREYNREYRENMNQEQRRRYRDSKREYMRRKRAEARQAV